MANVDMGNTSPKSRGEIVIYQTKNGAAKIDAYQGAVASWFR